MTKTTHFGPHYCERAFRPDELLAHARKYLEPHVGTFDTIACSGVSGVVAGSLLAMVYDKYLTIVRPESDTRGGSGNHYPVAGRMGERWVFVDDLVSTGKTRARVRHEIHYAMRHKHDVTWVGTYLYDRGASAWQPALNDAA